MNDARRWAEAMHALGLEWRVGMVTVDGDADPHHPSNLGHLRDMVREACASPDAHARPNAHGWRIYCPMRRELGTGETEAGAWLDALERKAREVKP